MYRKHIGSLIYPSNEVQLVETSGRFDSLKEQRVYTFWQLNIYSLIKRYVSISYHMIVPDQTQTVDEKILHHSGCPKGWFFPHDQHLGGASQVVRDFSINRIIPYYNTISYHNHLIMYQQLDLIIGSPINRHGIPIAFEIC